MKCIYYPKQCNRPVGFLINKRYVEQSKRLPKEFLFKSSVYVGEYSRDEVSLVSEGKIKSFMVCHKLNFKLRDDYDGDTLGIDFLLSNDKGKGYGTKLLNYAKNYSKQLGCNGYICLKADSTLSYYKAPHQFYRKNGFTTLDKVIDKKLDKFNKEGLQGSYLDFRPKLMFFPPQREIQNLSIWDKFVNFCNNLLS